MSADDKPLSEGDIQATNVLPAFEASLHFGASEEKLRRVLGWTRAALGEPNAVVSGASTYAHLELMDAKPGYASFVLAAVAAHEARSLGVVGLASKTAATVADALRCHERFQHLSNRTARYAWQRAAGAPIVVLTEHRAGPATFGSRLMSDYTMLVALQLLRLVSSEHPRVIAMGSRRTSIPSEEREAYERFLGAPIVLGHEQASLTVDASVLDAKTSRGDPELASYFGAFLEQNAPSPRLEPTPLQDVRSAIHERLPAGTPSIGVIARALGVGERTLQRRLSAVGTSFAAILDEARKELSARYLRATPTRTLVEIAFLLGYAEQASFYRAFRRWHGCTPAELRGTRV